TRTAPLTGRVLLLLLAAGALAVADAAAEVVYIAIPKKEEFLSAGCCTGTFDDGALASRFLPGGLVPDDWDGRLLMTYVGLGAALGRGSALGARLCRRGLPHGLLALLLVAAVLAVPVNGVFLVEVAAPRLIRLPYHHCPYDLVPRAPESLVAIALFLAGSFAVGWAALARAAASGAGAEARLPLRRAPPGLLDFGLLGYLWSVVLVSVGLALG